MKKIAYSLTTGLCLLQASALMVLCTKHDMDYSQLSFILSIICVAPILGIAILKTQEHGQNKVQ